MLLWERGVVSQVKPTAKQIICPVTHGACGQSSCDLFNYQKPQAPAPIIKPSPLRIASLDFSPLCLLLLLPLSFPVSTPM